MESLRLLIVDDHDAFRDGLRRLLAQFPQVQVVGEAGHGEEAVEVAKDLQPDIILMDLQMPGLNGIDATRRILDASPHVGVLVLTMFEDDDSVFAAMRAGARGYLLKGADRQVVQRAIQAVGNGEAIFSPAIAKKLIQYFSSSRPQTPHQAFPELSNREREVLELIASGRTNAEIAAQLYLSPKTIRNHVSNVFHKLQVVDRVQAIILARDAGLGQDER